MKCLLPYKSCFLILLFCLVGPWLIDWTFSWNCVSLMWAWIKMSRLFWSFDVVWRLPFCPFQKGSSYTLQLFSFWRVGYFWTLSFSSGLNISSMFLYYLVFMLYGNISRKTKKKKRPLLPGIHFYRSFPAACLKGRSFQVFFLSTVVALNSYTMVDLVTHPIPMKRGDVTL